MGFFTKILSKIFLQNHYLHIQVASGMRSVRKPCEMQTLCFMTILCFFINCAEHVEVTQMEHSLSKHHQQVIWEEFYSWMADKNIY